MDAKRCAVLIDVECSRLADTIRDLAGYCVLWLILWRLQNQTVSDAEQGADAKTK